MLSGTWVGPLHLALSPAVLARLRQRRTSDFCQFCSAGFLPPLIPENSLLSVVFLRRAQWILSVALDGFSDDLQLKFPPLGINVSENLSWHVSGFCPDLLVRFLFSSSCGGSVRNIGDNRTYFFFYRGIFIISSSGRGPRGFIYPLPPTPLFPWQASPVSSSLKSVEYFCFQ